MQKIVNGFVIQDFNDAGKCVEQHFVAGDECQWEDNDRQPGRFIDEPKNAEYFSYDMIQPKEEK